MKKWLGLFFGGVLMYLLIHYLQDPYVVDTARRLQGMSQDHILGTDYLGRDLFSRLVYGTVHSVVIGLSALSVVMLLSLFLGGLAGTFGRWLDTAITMLADIMVSIPSMILALVFVGLFSNSLLTVLLALVINWVGKYIRYIRNLVLNIRTEEYIILAPLHGSFGSHTLLHHVLPNIFVELASLFLTDLGKIILSISGLSFLGIGVQPPTPELGTILYDGKAYFFVAPWLFIFPGLILSGVMLGTHYAGQKISSRWQK